jgi:hypothetical protein
MPTIRTTRERITCFSARSLAQHGKHARFPHRDQFVGRTGQGDDDLVVFFEQQAGRGPVRVRQRNGAARHVGLAQDRRQHRGAANGKPVAQSLARSAHPVKRRVHHLGDHVPRQIVHGRAETADEDHQVGAVHGLPHGRDRAMEVVADRGPKIHVDAQRRQLLRQVRRVRVHDLAEQHLGPDGNHLSNHVAPFPSLHLRAGKKMFALCRTRPAKCKPYFTGTAAAACRRHSPMAA